MKAIVFSAEHLAQLAVEKCNTEIKPGKVEYVGVGPHQVPIPKPYTTYISHPTQQLFAVIADLKVEECLGESAVELTNDWFEN